jgi:hypothetical protein
VLLGSLVSMLAASTAPRPAPAPGGEHLTYRIRVGPLSVGHATIEVAYLTADDGDLVGILQFHARSRGLLSRLYPVRDDIVSRFDPDDHRCLALRRRIREGGFRERLDIAVDHAAGMAIRSDGGRFPVPSGCRDVFSTLMALRGQPPGPGAVLEVPVVLGAAAATLTVRVGPRRVVEVPAGRFVCDTWRPDLGGREPFRHDGPVVVDVETGPRRLPVRVTARIPVVGAVQAELVAARTGTAPSIRRHGHQRD